jgi:dTMP kinase
VTRGRFIVFEGGEGTGKSTQAARLAERLDAVLTHEPGATAVGARLRELMLSPETERLDDRAEALLMAADRAQHVSELIEPALRSGRHVVCDRYIGSSVAYQGYGRGLDPDMVRAVSGWAAAGLWPDVTILLTVPDDIAAARIGAARDRIEAAGDDFHRRVIEGFREQAADEPEHWIEVDGTGTPDEVEDRVLDAVAEVFGPALDLDGPR